MLTGEVPFKGDSQVAVAMKHVREEVPDVQTKRAEVSSALAAVLETATAKRMENRYADDAAAILAFLGEVMATQPTAFTHALAALDLITEGVTEIAVAGDRPDLVAAVHGRANASLAVGYGYSGILVSFLARHNPMAIVPVAILLGGISASGGLLQRRLDLPDAAVVVLQGILFVAILASETLYGRPWSRLWKTREAG